jgi:hypothetical protein
MRWKTEQAVQNSHLVQKRYDFFGDDTSRPNFVIHQGTIQSATSTTVTLASDASSTDDAYKGYSFQIGTEDRARITSYVGSTKVATLSAAFGTIPTTGVGKVINRGY